MGMRSMLRSRMTKTRNQLSLLAGCQLMPPWRSSSYSFGTIYRMDCPRSIQHTTWMRNDGIDR